jgi:integrase/recombinase XerC
MYACGLRISEALSLEVTAVDRARRVLRIIGKGNKERLVPLPQPMLEALSRCANPSQPSLDVPKIVVVTRRSMSASCR